MEYIDIRRLWSYLIASVLGFFEPIGMLVLWALIFILADMVTGIYAAFCNGELITSHKMQRTVVKFLMYSSAIILLEGLDVYIINFMDMALARIGATLICSIELYSIFENCYKATGNVVFKVLTQTVKKKVNSELGIEVEKEDLQNKK